MNKLLSLMHDTSGQTNRIRLRAEEFYNEIKKVNPDFLNQKLTKNENLTIDFFLIDIKNSVERLEKTLDAFYLANKETP